MLPVIPSGECVNLFLGSGEAALQVPIITSSFREAVQEFMPDHAPYREQCAVRSPIRVPTLWTFGLQLLYLASLDFWICIPLYK